MKPADFLMCKFEGDPNRDYFAEVTNVKPGGFTCRFVHSGTVYEFESDTWTVSKPGNTFPVGTPLTEHATYTLSDDQIFPMPGSESKLVCVTFSDNNKYLGQLNYTDSFLGQHVTFLHSGSKYVFDSDKRISDSGGTYPEGTNIKTIQIYVPTEPAKINMEDGEEIESRPGALHTDWRSFFQSYTMDQIQDAIATGNSILQKMIDSTVAKAKLISHAFANPIEGKELINGAFKAALAALTGNEDEFIKKVSKSMLGVFVGSFAEILRANQAREVSSTRQGFYKAYADGCFYALYGDSSFRKLADTMEQQFFELGFQTTSNLSPRPDLTGDAMLSEFSRADLLIASVEGYRLRPGQLDIVYNLDDYLRSLSDADIPYQGFMARLSTFHNRIDD